MKAMKQKIEKKQYFYKQGTDNRNWVMEYLLYGKYIKFYFFKFVSFVVIKCFTTHSRKSINENQIGDVWYDSIITIIKKGNNQV